MFDKWRQRPMLRARWAPPRSLLFNWLGCSLFHCNGTNERSPFSNWHRNFTDQLKDWNFIDQPVAKLVQTISDTYFYRTQVSLGSGLWVPVSLSIYVRTAVLWNFADVTLADDDTNSILLMVPMLSNSLLFVLNAIYASSTSWWSKQNFRNFGGELKYKSDYKK